MRSIRFLVDLDEYLLPAQTYDLITTTFYLNHNLVPSLEGVPQAGGFALHEHHYLTDYDVSGPTDAQFRLRSNELLRLFSDFRVRFFSEGLEWEPGRTAAGWLAIERLVAQKPPATTSRRSKGRR